MISFLSCDWGTSSFRLSLVNPESFSILASETSDKGILDTFNAWNEIPQKEPATRFLFYLAIISEHITAVEKKTARSLNGVPLLISGMASSSIGMMPLDYHELPFAVDGSSIGFKFFSQTPEFQHDILLISGVRSRDDVMRGEETQLIGMVTETDDAAGDRLFIFPGTHSKHILINGKQALQFKTFMTGEFFELLSKKSILHAGLEKSADQQNADETRSFEQGVKEGAESNLLNACFKVRTNALFNHLTKKENYYYLSGLLIGAELGEIVQNDTFRIYLCSGAHLKQFYETALRVLGHTGKVHSFPAETVETAAIRGQYKIFENHTKQ